MLSPLYAVAYTPPPDSPLAKFGAGILGYDCFEAADVPQRAVPGVNPAFLSLLTTGSARASCLLFASASRAKAI